MGQLTYNEFNPYQFPLYRAKHNIHYLKAVYIVRLMSKHLAKVERKHFNRKAFLGEPHSVVAGHLLQPVGVRGARRGG